jgi:hypothetical protein
MPMLAYTAEQHRPAKTPPRGIAGASLPPGASAPPPLAPAFVPVPVAAIPSRTPLNLQTYYGYLAAPDASTFAHSGSGSGTNNWEQFEAVDPDNPDNMVQLQPGQLVIFRSNATGLYMRLAPYNGTINAKSAPRSASTIAASVPGFPSLRQRSPPPAKLPAATIKPLSKAQIGASSKPLPFASKPLPSAGKVLPSAGKVLPLSKASLTLATTRKPPPQTQPPPLGIRPFYSLVRMPRVRLSVNAVLGLLADEPNAALATRFVFTQQGLTFQDIPLKSAGTGQPLLWSNSTVLTGRSEVAITTARTGAPGGGRGCQ